VAAAYLIPAATPQRPESALPVLDQLLGPDPLALDRGRLARTYLGDRPGDDTPLRRALLEALGEPDDTAPCPPPADVGRPVDSGQA
jgi:hypothetical protein